MNAMDEPLTWKQKMTHPRTLGAIALGVLVGAAGAAGGWYVWLKPQRELARLRYDAMMDVLKLYDLQVKYKQARGAYANDLESLLASSGDKEALRARLALHVDMNTIAVVDQGEKFRVEVNVLDKDRTLMKIKGPPPEFTPRAVPVVPTEPGLSPLSNGGAVAPPPAAR